MKTSNEFAVHAAELLSTVGHVVAQRMFGGHGLYCDGTMFALIAGDALYLKVDEANRSEFERAGATPFAYETRGRWIVMSYFSAPDQALESRELAAPWARSAYAAALRARASKGTAARLSRRK
jgi:DNA transformation protein and related proteins